MSAKYQQFCSDVNSHVKPFKSSTPKNDDKCCIYAPLNWIIIGSDNGLASIRHQVINNNENLTSITPQGTDFNEKKISKLTNFHWRNFTQNHHNFPNMSGVNSLLFKGVHGDMNQRVLISRELLKHDQGWSQNYISVT